MGKVVQEVEVDASLELPMTGFPEAFLGPKSSNIAVPKTTVQTWTRRPHIFMTFPVYNEVSRLEGAIREVAATLDLAGTDYQLAIAEDGSNDGTKSLIHRLRKEFPSMIVQMLDQKRGRGFAVRSLWSNWDADIYVFSDVDLATGTEALLRAIRLAEKGVPLVTGSRYVTGASVNRPPLRSFVSLQYNRLTRLWFGDQVQDHQCGLKVFTRNAVRKLLTLTREDSWFWDTEVLVRAHQVGLEVVEIPVNWIEKKSARTRPSRLLSDMLIHGIGLMRLKGAMSVSEKNRGNSRPMADRNVGLSAGPSISLKYGANR
jgi:glycosyltransferase involved in cell wall biosynthesis